MISRLFLVLAIVLGANANYDAYSTQGQGQVQVQPMSTETTVQSPCTVEVMRATEIQLFANPQDPASYLICTDVDVFLSMPCAPGTVFNAAMRHCAPEGWESPACPVGTCFNNADCVVDEMNQATCLCRVGFTGQRCEVNIDECALEGNQACAANNGRCVDQTNAYYCEFNGGNEIGMTFETRIERPCTIENIAMGKQFFDLNADNGAVFLQCTSEMQFVVTRCADLLFWHQELKTCSIERPLVKTGVCKNFPCMNDGICNDLGGSNFQCVCKEGFTGSMCEEVIDFCVNSPCASGRCENHSGGFNCICEDNVVDKSCATGVKNPCELNSNNYLPNMIDSTKYFSCSLGFGFVKSCAPGLVWSQDRLTCVRREGQSTYGQSYGQETSYGQSYGQETTTRPTIPTLPQVQSYGQETSYGQSYGQETTTRPTLPTLPSVQSYGQETTTRPTIPTLPQVQSYGQEVVTPAPVVMRPTFTRPEFVRPSMPSVQSYGQEVVTQAPVVTRPTIPTLPSTPSYGQMPQRTFSQFGQRQIPNFF